MIASPLPLRRRSNASGERTQGTTVAFGMARSAAWWLNEPSSPWIAIFMIFQTWIYLCRYGNSCFVKRTIPYRSAHICGEIDTNALDNLRSIAGAVAVGLRRLPCTGSIYPYSAFDRVGGSHSAACRRPSNGRLEWIFHRSTPQQGRRTRLLH